jgi:hypothetical protein|tara:strand:+ start:3348 stop:3917 length:570 start_codon:yes stop_codon:yes gene_type:complete
MPPLVIPRGTGDGAGFIRFKPTENAWLTSGPDGIEEFEWTSPVVIDIENVETGWLLLASGVRDWLPCADRANPDEKPEGDYKFGVCVKFFGPKLWGEDNPIRELCTSTVGVVQFVENLFSIAEAKFKDGVPVVQIEGAKAIKIGKGSTRVPEFTIKKFVKRPEALLNGLDVGKKEQQKPTEPDDEDIEF